MRRLFLFFILVEFASCSCLADMLYLKDGQSIEGEVIYMDKEDVKVVLPYGTLTVKRIDVSKIELGDVTEEPRERESSEEEPKETKEEPSQPDSADQSTSHLELSREFTLEREMKSPRRAAMLAVIPGAGYAYLDRWDLTLAAAGIEVSLAALGLSLVNDEGEGNNSTGFVVLGFLGLLKVAEVFDSHDRAVNWNKNLGQQLGRVPGSGDPGFGG